jgi:predicted nucleotidyltransferase
MKEKIRKILETVHDGATFMFSENLKSTILYGSYARGDYESDSDIDIMVLVDMDKSDLSRYRKKIANLSSNIDLEYDVFTSIKLQDYKTYNDWLNVVPFYQSVQREGVFVNG